MKFVAQCSEIISAALRRNDLYHEVLPIVTANSSGESYIIGGFVYRTIAAALYDVPCVSCDFDFVVEQRAQTLVVPDGWLVTTNSYGTPKVVRGQQSFDLPMLAEWHSIQRRGLSCTMANLLTGTPLKIQSIAYNIQEARVCGDIGLEALLSKTVSVNDPAQAMVFSQRKKRPLLELIEEKARQLNFRPIYPD